MNELLDQGRSSSLFYGWRSFLHALFANINIAESWSVYCRLHRIVMTDDDSLYQSWMIRGSYFNRMLDCGDWHNQWVQNALEYLPRDLLDAHKERLAFVAMDQRDGCRLTRAFSQNRDVIILAEQVLPKAGANELQSDVRYFIYVVLHEVAHAIKNHRSPLLDTLSEEEVEAQEREADDLALEWFNEHIAACGNPHFVCLTQDEVKAAEARSRATRQRLHNGT